MPIVSFVTPKGGAGKTTATVLIACGLAERGHRVAIIDTDPNQPIQSWAEKDIPPPPSITVYPNVKEVNLLDTIDTAEEHHDWVLIDGEGSANLASSYSIAASQFVIVPAQKSQLDAKEAVKAIKMIQNASRSIKADIPFRLLFMRTNASVVAGVQRAIETNFGEVEAMPVELAERSAYQAIFAYGGSLSTLPKTGAGAGNIANAQKNADAVVDAVIELSQALSRKVAA